MANEKMSILQMLQDGKLTANEAARLLAALEPAQEKPAAAPTTTPCPAPNAPVPNRPYAPDKKTGGDFNDFARKAGAFAKGMEPKIQKLTEVVAETTVGLANKISQGIAALEEGAARAPQPTTPQQTAPRPTPAPRPTVPRPTAPPARPTVYQKTAAPAPIVNVPETTVELPVEALTAAHNTLSLAGLNADVRIKGYNGDKISARIHTKPKRPGAKAEFIVLGTKYTLHYEADDFHSVGIDAYVPAHLFHTLRISNLGGALDIANLQCPVLAIENTNGPLNATDLDAAVLSLANCNGPITLQQPAFTRYDDYQWQVETSNAKLTLHVPAQMELGYHINAHTVFGEIHLGLSGLEYLANAPGAAEARSAHFETSTKKVRLSLETSNAPLMVN